MKKSYIFASLALFFAFACNKPAESGSSDSTTVAGADASVSTSETANVQSGPLAAFDFPEKEFDFGTIKAGDVVKHTFKFKNTGSVPLIISDISTSCGCTTPDYTKDPVQPGASGEVTLQFNSTGKEGEQNKVSTVKANVEGGEFQIRILAKVLGAAGTSEGPLKK